MAIEDFDEYIKQSEPYKRGKGYAWQTDIGLQAVDGLKPSDYLIETARRDIEGEITIDEAEQLIKSYYQSKEVRTAEDDEKQEADLASTNIRRILAEKTFASTLVGLTSIHRRIFDGVFKFAGQIRDYNITKKEWVLRGDTVLNVSAPDTRPAIEYDLEQERAFNYSQVNREILVEHRQGVVNIPDGLKVEKEPHPTTTQQVPNNFTTTTQQVLEQVKAIGDRNMSVKEMMASVGLKDRVNFLRNYLNPAIQENVLRLLYSNKPNHPRQKYLLTVKGIAILN